MRAGRQNGFLLLEILVAGVILTAGIACAMYLFRSGFEHLERADRANLLSAKLLQAGSLLKITDLERRSGSEDLGDGVTMKWTAQLAGSSLPHIYARDASGSMEAFSGHHEIYLYRVDFGLEYKGTVRNYRISIFHSRPLYWR